MREPSRPDLAVMDRPSLRDAANMSDRRVAPEWEVWAAENLLRGVPRSEVVAQMIEAGATEVDARACLDTISASPAFVAALPFARDARRFWLQTQLRRAMALLAADPVGIPRRSGV